MRTTCQGNHKGQYRSNKPSAGQAQGIARRTAYLNPYKSPQLYVVSGVIAGDL